MDRFGNLVKTAVDNRAGAAVQAIEQIIPRAPDVDEMKVAFYPPVHLLYVIILLLIADFIVDVISLIIGS